MRADLLDRARVRVHALEKTIAKLVEQSKRPGVPEHIQAHADEADRYVKACMAHLEAIEDKMFRDADPDYRRRAEETTREHKKEGEG
jgi:septation ring formation regulator EzrA